MSSKNLRMLTGEKNMNDDIMYNWTTTFQDLKYQAEKRGQGETEFSTCRKCLEKLDYFNEKDMLAQGKAFGVTVFFVPCEEHDGITA